MKRIFRLLSLVTVSLFLMLLTGCTLYYDEDIGDMYQVKEVVTKGHTTIRIGSVKTEQS